MSCLSQAAVALSGLAPVSPIRWAAAGRHSHPPRNGALARRNGVSGPGYSAVYPPSSMIVSPLIMSEAGDAR